jgi:hypothetical protein
MGVSREDFFFPEPRLEPGFEPATTVVRFGMTAAV